MADQYDYLTRRGLEADCARKDEHIAEFRADLVAKETEIARLREALAWYAERASSLANKDWKDNADYALAIFAELSLDGGIRARAAIGKGE